MSEVEVPRDERAVQVTESGTRVKPRAMSIQAYHEKLMAAGYYENGEENPDPTPMQPPVGFKRQPSMVEHIRAMVQSELLRREARAADAETFEEADDFDLPDGDVEPWSRYEAEDDEPSVADLRARLAAAEARQTSGQGPAQPAREALDGSVAPSGSPSPSPSSGTAS